MTAVYETAKQFNRILYWDDDNRLTKTVDTTSGASVTTQYHYDAKGMRIIKDGPYGKSIYIDTGYVESSNAPGAAPMVASNHVFVGNTRIASVVKHRDEANPAMYYYASDHLGSSSVLTTNTGSYHERIEYLPYGETWVEEKASTSGYSTPYKFTGKELDPETGLYYFGARYYDARVSRWISADPALEKYIPDRKKEKDKEEKLPAGGIYEPANIDVYGYVGNNPILYIDPDGNFRFGKRPLSNNITWTTFLTGLIISIITESPINIEKSFVLMDKGNFEPIHEHGFYDNSNENIGYGDTGFMYKEKRSEYIMGNEVYDDILMKKAEENVKNSGAFDIEDYSLLGIGKKPKNNCQDFADAMREEYNKLYNNLDAKGKKEVDARVETIKQRIQQEEEKK
jgi:RHS repeat-associated protein